MPVRGVDAAVTLVNASGVNVSGAAAAVLDDTFNPTVTPVSTFGAIVLASTQGAAGEVSRVMAHTSASDARVNTINGLVVQSRLYAHNHNTPGSGTDDLVRTANAAAGNSGTGLLGVGSLNFDGSNWQKRKGATDGTTLIGGFTTVVTATVTRPSDSAVYAAGDQVSNSTSAPTIITFTNAARFSGGTGVIVGAMIADSVAAATLPDLELWLFDTTATPNNDNAAFAPTDGVTNTAVAVIHLVSSYGATNNAILDSGPLNIPYLTVGSANLFGMLVVRNAYTPSSAEIFQIRLKLLQD